jgi:hypothetical protein
MRGVGKEQRLQTALGVGHGGAVVSSTDTARFRADDPDALVVASLTCPYCLRSESVEWDAALDGYDPSVECSCSHCDETWRVYLTPEQALRLGLMLARAV